MPHMPPLTDQWKQQEQDRLLDLTPHRLFDELLLALRNTGQEARFTSEYATRILVQLDLVCRILKLCHACMQHSTANQWAKYCHVTCRPPTSIMPLHEDPTGTLRLVYPLNPPHSNSVNTPAWTNFRPERANKRKCSSPQPTPQHGKPPSGSST